jgi:hypothetical protein
VGPVILLAKDLAFVAANGQAWSMDWIAVPAEYQLWQLVFVVKTRVGGTLQVFLDTTWDTDSTSNVAGGSLGAVGTTIIDITSGMGPLARLRFNPVGTTQLMFSAYLTPKAE